MDLLLLYAYWLSCVSRLSSGLSLYGIIASQSLCIMFISVIGRQLLLMSPVSFFLRRRGIIPSSHPLGIAFLSPNVLRSCLSIGARHSAFIFDGSGCYLVCAYSFPISTFCIAILISFSSTRMPSLPIWVFWCRSYSHIVVDVTFFAAVYICCFHHGVFQCSYFCPCFAIYAADRPCIPHTRELSRDVLLRYFEDYACVTLRSTLVAF